VYQRSRHRNPLALADGELIGALFELVPESDPAQQLLRIPCHFMIAPDGAHHHVFHRAQVVDQEVLLEDESKSLPPQPHQAAGRDAAIVTPLERDAPPGGAFQSGEQVHQ